MQGSWCSGFVGRDPLSIFSRFGGSFEPPNTSSADGNVSTAPIGFGFGGKSHASNGSIEKETVLPRGYKHEFAGPFSIFICRSLVLVGSVVVRLGLGLGLGARVRVRVRGEGEGEG